MKIVFIDPKGDQLGLNTGLAYLAAMLIKERHQVHVIDLNNFTKFEDKRLKNVINADIIGFSVKAFTLDETKRICKKIKKLNKHAMLIAGGAQITTDSDGFMRDNPEFDIGLIGEAEYTIIDIVKNKELNNIPGIIFRKNGKIIKTSGRPLIRELDKLPFPEYDCFDSISIYKIPLPYRWYPLVTSRGCPCNCLYCSVPLISGKNWRARSPENVIKELSHYKKHWGIKEFAINDDNFTVNIKRAKKICKLLIDSKLNLKWQCPNGIKGQYTDQELAILMKRSGLFMVNIGIESGVDKIFESIGKGGTLRHVERAIEYFRNAKVCITGFFLIGLPNSTAKEDLLSLKYAKKLNLDVIIFSFVTPYPGTKLFKMLKENKEKKYRIISDWRKGQDLGRHPTPIFETNKYSAKERIDSYYLINLRSKFYGAIIDMNSSNLLKFWDILTAILKHDPWNLFYHLYWVTVGMITGIKNKTVKIGM